MKRFWTIVLALLMLTMAASALGEGTVIIGQGASQGFDELKVGESIRVKGEYKLELLDAYAWGDARIRSMRWTYLDSAENGAKQHYWEFPLGTHTYMAFHVEMTNLSMEEVNFLDRVKCQIVYDDQYVFDTTPMQLNPDQTNDAGKTGHVSIVARKMEPLEGTKVRIVCNVPYIVRDSNKPLKAYFTVDDSMTYEVNLRDILVINNATN